MDYFPPKALTEEFPTHFKYGILFISSYGVVIFITCLQSLRLTPPLRATETKFRHFVVTNLWKSVQNLSKFVNRLR